ncbi:MAG: L-2-hydroxyglutarate oxidase [Actinomycetes bacterium]
MQRHETDVVVVGGGILGLATALRLLERDPARHVTVLEAEDRVGAHQSSHNSGVLHAGVYYAPGSAKARLCREGKAALEAYADATGIPRTEEGKVIVATDPSELDRLDDLEARARANGVPGLERIDAAGIAALEPHVVGIAGLHSPTTGSIDFGVVCEAFARDVTTSGRGEVRTGVRVTGIEQTAGGVTVTARHAAGAGGALDPTAGADLEVRAGAVVTCAGLWSDRVAALTGDDPEPAIVPFRGAWLELTPAASHLVRGHVYPVPDPTLPFLGVHASRRVDGRVWIGPNAVLAPRRDVLARGADARDLRDALSTAALWRLGRRFWRTGAAELVEDRIRALYLRRVRRYVPAVTADDVLATRPAGIRAQALGPDGTLVDDFVFGGTGRVVHVRNAPSPAATASLAIGRVLADRVEQALDRPSA